jgi:hypothetical protein
MFRAHIQHIQHVGQTNIRELSRGMGGNLSFSTLFNKATLHVEFHHLARVMI